MYKYFLSRKEKENCPSLEKRGEGRFFEDTLKTGMKN